MQMYKWLVSLVSLLLHFSEIDKYDSGLLIELWDKGMLWDKAIGYFWAPLHFLQFTRLVSRTILQNSHNIFLLIIHGTIWD